MYYPMYVDPTYILIIIGVLLSLAASTKVKSTFGRYSQVRSLSGLTGAQTAERILRQAGIYDVGKDVASVGFCIWLHQCGCSQRGSP